MTVSENLFSDSYLKFTHLLSKVYVEEEAAEIRIPEKTIRCIWNDQLFKKPRLHTTDGEELEVIFPGYWNFGKGPDFKSAAIKVDGKTFEGDVEIHVYSTDWKAHDHSSNPDFDKVILHVFMWKGRGKGKTPPKPSRRKSSRMPGAHIYELELKHFLTKGILELNEELDFDHYPVLNQFNYGRCHKPLSRLPGEKLRRLLNAAGDARVFTKMERFHDRLIINGYGQTFYEGVAEALGYPINKQPFQTLAENLPLTTLKNLLPSRGRKSERVLHAQAMMFGVSGLIGSLSADSRHLPPEDKKYFAKLGKLWEQYRDRIPASPMNAREWKFSGIRPANYPYRRIAGLAHLVVRHELNGMFADFMNEFQSVITQSGSKGYIVKIPKKVFNFFCVEANDYWTTHYSPGGKKLAHPQQLIGPSRSSEITINIVLPIGLIYARACKSVELESGLNLLFQSRKNTGDNKLIRFMKHYIFGNKEEMLQTLSSDKQVQGLMQVYQDFCTQNENNCLRCQFPEVVNRYFARGANSRQEPDIS